MHEKESAFRDEIAASTGDTGLLHLFSDWLTDCGAERPISPFRTVLAYQAHHLDVGFYDRFYRPGAYTETVAGHLAAWHPDRTT